MEKYESLVVAVVFQHFGMYAYNRQQLCEFTTKDLNSDFNLCVGEIFRHDGYEYEIKNIHFSMEPEWYSSQKVLNVFTTYDNNPINCKVVVFIERL
jgi:hypothetical protein